MPTVIQFFVQAFRGDASTGLAPLPLKTAPTDRAAIATAERLASQHGGAVAWSQTVDKEADAYGEPEVLARFGTVPDEVV